MLSLVFTGKESEHLVKQHPHEAPKVMLIPAAVLAGLCIVWGFAEPLVATFMHVNLGITLLGSFTDIETPIFLALLVPTGLIVYWSYYKNYQAVRNVGGGSNPIATMLKHGYFFDDIYYAAAKGIAKFSDGLKHVEDAGNQSLNSFAAGFVRASQKLKKVPSTTVQNYIAAGIVGLILIVVLIILTVGV
jgi:NADH:ubiquinone oxidoreductase subunit 5 (subunit L)/multisubunit Na+/H+ antiporter MnhA subunit